MYYHAFTEGLKKDALFRNDEEFRAGMDRIGFAKLKSRVSVLCAHLMDNHVHFLLEGTPAGCRHFMTVYKKLTSMWIYSNAAEYRKILGMEICIKEVDGEDYLRTVIGYIIRNSVAAGSRIIPADDRWSTSGLYFRAEDKLLPDGCRSVSEISQKNLRSILRTRIQIPGDWLLQKDGMIWPGSYTDFRAVERIFRSVKSYLYALSRNNEFEVNSGMQNGRITFFSDRELRDIAKTMSFASGKTTPCQDRVKHKADCQDSASLPRGPGKNNLTWCGAESTAVRLAEFTGHPELPGICPAGPLNGDFPILTLRGPQEKTVPRKPPTEKPATEASPWPVSQIQGCAVDSVTPQGRH